MNAINMLQSNMTHTLLCVGLDPDINKIPFSITNGHEKLEDKIYTFLISTVEKTVHQVCAYKIQKAFFDLYSGGHDLLRSIVQYIHAYHPDVPVIIDCKIGDIDNTMSAYIENIFGHMQADGIVVNPYMGLDVIMPLMELAEKAIVVLCKTSNPGGSIIQDMPLWNNIPVWQHVLKQTTSCWNRNGNMVPVISSTASLSMQEVRRIIPQEMPILLAGVGAQGGSYDDLGQLLNDQRSGVFVNSSRGILYPYDRSNTDWTQKIGSAAIELMDRLNTQR